MKYLRNYSGKQSTGKKKESNTTSAPKIKTPTSQQGPRPPVLTIEDDDYDDDIGAFERRLKFLEREWKKPIPDEFSVKELMRKTFRIRRQKIQEVPTKVGDLLKMYPALRSYDHVST